MSWSRLDATFWRQPEADLRAAEAVAHGLPVQVGCAGPERAGDPRQMVSAINEIWSMDFVADNLFDGRRLRTLTIVENYTRECLAIEVDGSLRGEHVVAALTQLAQCRPLPRYIKTDNGSEFISKALDRWAYENGAEIDFSRPGKPTDNAKSESFNGRFREHWFLSMADARRKNEV